MFKSLNLISLWLVLAIWKLYQNTMEVNCVTIVVSNRTASKSEPSKCTTPDHKEGTCIVLQECKNLYDQLIYHGREPAVQKFLQKSQCGRRDLPPYVCCPKISIDCGKTLGEVSTKIVGGQPAELGSWPWIAAIYCENSKTGKKRFQCGGSLISTQWVVTAGHCLACSGQNTKLSHVRLGDLDINDTIIDGATPIDISIKEIIPHPKYRSQPLENDIALLQLMNPVTYTEFIRPICLLSGSERKSESFYNKKKPLIAGWGAVQYRNVSSSHLLETSITVVNSSKCTQDYAKLTKQAVIDKRVICAEDEGKDSCQGDSGGPLVFVNSTTHLYHLGGIVSFGVGCANKYPGVYTKIAEFVDWINENTGLSF